MKLGRPSAQVVDQITPKLSLHMFLIAIDQMALEPSGKLRRLSRARSKPWSWFRLFRLVLGLDRRAPDNDVPYKADIAVLVALHIVWVGDPFMLELNILDLV